jgi:hypothetical protein
LDRQIPALLRTIVTSAFVLFMLASAHLVMVVINAAEHRWSRPDPQAGLTARLLTDRPVAEELGLALKKARSVEAQQALLTAMAMVESGRPLEVRTLPVTPFLGWVAVGLTLLGLVLVWATSRVQSDAAQSILGIFGGNLIWTGGVEYGLTIAARTFGLGKALTVVDGQVVAVYGEYVLLKYTWGAMALIIGYLVFLEASRCPIFLWWRERVPTMRGPIAAGRIDNYGPRSAFQYTTTVWAFYLLLLWAYDENVFGVHGLFTRAVLLLSIAGSIYCVRRLHQHTGWGPSVRYAVGAMIVVWTPIEIVGKWGLLKEPWLILQPESMIVFFGGLALGTWWLWRAQKRTPVTSKPMSQSPESALA